MTDRDDDESLPNRLKAMVVAALPTMRHARLLLDAVVERLGDAGWVLVDDGARHVAVYRLDATCRDWMSPWPLVSLTEQDATPDPDEVEFVAPMAEDGAVMSMAAALTTSECHLVPADPARPSRLGRAMVPGSMAISEGATQVRAHFGDDGKLLPWGPTRAMSDSGTEVDFWELAERLLADFDGPGTATERLADRVARLDPTRAYPARVRAQLGGLFPLGVWRGAIGPMNAAMLAGAIAEEADWVYVDERCRFPVQWTKDIPPFWPGVVVPLPAANSAAISAAWRAAGFTRRVRLVGARGEIRKALVRGDPADRLTLVGDELVGALEPATLDQVLDWLHLEHDQSWMSRDWRPPAIDVPPELVAQLPLGWVAPTITSVFVTYTPDPRSGRLAFGGMGYGPAFDAGVLTGLPVEGHVLRTRRIPPAE